MALNADPADINSNSFADLDFANEYFENRLYVTDWGDSNRNAANQAKALVWASTIINRAFTWKGTKRIIEQVLAFPRYGLRDYDDYYVDQDTVPLQIKEATCELALTLLQANPQSDNPLDSGITNISVGSIKLRFDKDAIMNGANVDGNQLPEKVVSILSEFMEGSTNTVNGCIRVMRI